ncbi:hypothetical protein FLJC2902T_22630 [Flavobacterium limnosediminis JC2902]|uniref:ATPase AAA-type core domain-containing protein n=1 Tax=Flavobacterium limnosediminis JC2902 TaxID=1341181 RepID=V6SRN8_9FLAO|nr:AAA family ATPase [Flavobacterium limnosediminis]ESU27085.1 hypothetical protein FLJC2902T_22630 [Flavobacterium limnosediminis JC2902]
MDFYLSDSRLLQRIEKKNIIVLNHSSWDDWFTYNTLYRVSYYDDDYNEIILGPVKIGEFNMEERIPRLPEKFTSLDDTFFSVGQDVSYYELLNSKGEVFRDAILEALNDISLKNELFDNAIKERVTKQSLLRSVSLVSVKGEYRRLAQGIVELTPYDFTFYAPKHFKSSINPMVLDFSVKPKSNPPTNIHVIIGRNGVGKTHLFNNMITSLIEERSSKKVGYFESKDDFDIPFANLVSVSFSAFDDSNPIVEKRDKTKSISYSYIGLKKIEKGNIKQPPKSPTVLKNEFVKSIEICRLGAKNERWLNALKTLETDPIFKEAEVSQIAKLGIEEDFTELASNIFKNLSSGHKIVLLTITRLVETVEERSLVLLDEPEGYLHPPLLSAFIRALSDLLKRRNAVAIIGTHSPVVLQEVPKNCIWNLRRHGADAIAERLEMESFGENVGTLTQEVFGLEVTDSGFHRILKDIAERTENFDEAITKFNNQLGLEARAILRNLFYQKNL